MSESFRWDSFVTFLAFNVFEPYYALVGGTLSPPWFAVVLDAAAALPARHPAASDQTAATAVWLGVQLAQSVGVYLFWDSRDLDGPLYHIGFALYVIDGLLNRALSWNYLGPSNITASVALAWLDFLLTCITAIIFGVEAGALVGLAMLPHVAWQAHTAVQCSRASAALAADPSLLCERPLPCAACGARDRQHDCGSPPPPVHTPEPPPPTPVRARARMQPRLGSLV